MTSRSRHQLPDDVEQWNDRIHRTVMPIVRDEEVARDIAQDVWVRYMEHRPDQAEEANVGGWLTTVARRLALNHIASGQVRFRAAVTVDTINPPSTGPSPDDEAALNREAERIAAVFEELNPRHAKIIKLCDVDGLSYADAAEELEISESAVTSLLHRARTSFRREYLLSIAPAWLRGIGENGPVDEVLNEIDPFAPPDELSNAVEQRTHDLFASIAGRWDRIRTATVPSELDAAVAARAALAPDDNALDVGTGTGVVAMHVAPKVRRVVGIDRSLPMLKVARDRVQTSGRNNVLMEFGDLLALPIRPNSIDVAFCSLVLRLVQKPGEAIGNIAQTLHPGGRIVVCDSLRQPGVGGQGLSPRQLSDWMGNAGLERVTVDEVRGADDRYIIAVGHRRK